MFIVVLALILAAVEHPVQGTVVSQWGSHRSELARHLLFSFDIQKNTFFLFFCRLFQDFFFISFGPFLLLLLLLLLRIHLSLWRNEAAL